jgi:hypothetical protein
MLLTVCKWKRKTVEKLAPFITKTYPGTIWKYCCYTVPIYMYSRYATQIWRSLNKSTHTVIGKDFFCAKYLNSKPKARSLFKTNEKNILETEFSYWA